MKQTAVEWFVNEILMPEYGNIPEWVIDKVNEAKAMEKEQITDAYVDGADKGEMFNNENRAFTTDSEQYYNKTFKSE